MSLEEELIRAEGVRRRALVEDDMELLATVLADDLVHVHTTGNVHGKRQLLEHAGAFLRFLDVERRDLAVRPLGSDAAVMTGPMVNTVKRRDREETVTVHAFVTQVWVRERDRWVVKSFHATRQEPPG